MEHDLALFRTFPTLAERVPRRAFLAGPTPIEPLSLPGLGPDVFVKRDDRSCPLYGGNKPRKLEFVLGHALARGSRRVVTTGGLGTNHGLATTILGREVGLATTLVLVHQPVTGSVRRTVCLQAAFGARLVYGGGVAGAALQTARVLAGSALRGERPLLVPTGGSSLRGDLGFVSAGLELAEQVRSGQVPEPAEVFLAVGSGGSLVGLVVGMRLAGLRTRARGVLVTDIVPPSPRGLLRTAARCLRWLRRLEPRVPDVPLEREDFALIRDQVGPGYGAATPDALAAVEAATAAGLALDRVYTGKCLAALRARAPGSGKAATHGPILFWNTYSSVDPAGLLPGAPTALDVRRSVQALPQPFRRILEEPEDQA